MGSLLLLIFHSLPCSLHHHPSAAQGHLHTSYPTYSWATTYLISTGYLYPFVALQPNFLNTSCREHSLSFSLHFSYAMPLLHTMPLVQLFLYIGIVMQSKKKPFFFLNKKQYFFLKNHHSKKTIFLLFFYYYLQFLRQESVF